MSKCEKLLAAARQSPGGMRFSDLVTLAECHGFRARRQSGSHLIVSRPGLRRPIPMQQGENGKAKAYQVRQLLGVIDADGGAGDE